jgi:hypothetical protein
MCCNKILCVGIMVVLALFLGCNKGKNSADKKFEIGKTLSSSSTADTADIFKEFYSEDTAKKSPSKKESGKTAKTIAKNETFSPASAASSSQAEFSENGRYVVQVSCVKSQRFAEKIVAGLKDKRYPAYVAEVQNPTPNLSGAYYRIRIGGFNGFSAAKAFGENTLTPNGYQYWVDKKSNDKVGMEGYGLGTGPENGKATSSYESAPASSSWSGSPASSSPSQSSGSPSVSSSNSAFTPDASAPAKGNAETNPGVGSQSQPASTPSASSGASSAPSSANQSSSAPSNAPAPTKQPSSAAAPAPSSSPAAAGVKSPSTGSGSSEWGTDSSANGSGW